jgi:TonB family protein
MSYGTDNTVSLKPLHRRGVLLSITVHVAVLGILFFVLPKEHRSDRTEQDPVEVVFFSNPVQPDQEPPPALGITQIYVTPLQQEVTTPRVPSPPSRNPLPEPQEQVENLRPNRLQDKVFEDSPVPVSPLPETPSMTVRTTTFGHQQILAEHPVARHTATGVFESGEKPGENKAMVSPVKPETRLAGFGGEPAQADNRPTKPLGLSPMPVRSAGFNSSVSQKKTSGRAASGPSRQSGKSTTTITNISFDSTPDTDQIPASRPRSVRSGTFGRQETAPRNRTVKKLPREEPDEPVEIVSKPTPAYTEEARRLRVEGVVLLEVLFEASGRLRVLRVLQGLGHGLDEAAVEATHNIKYKSARREGRAVDHTATLRVVFQLA